MLHHSFFNSTNYNLFKKCQYMKKTKGFYKIKTTKLKVMLLIIFERELLQLIC